MPNKNLTLSHVNVFFHVKELGKSIDFHTNSLEFKLDFKYGSNYARLHLNNFELHLSSQCPYKNNTGHRNICLIIPEVDELYHKLQSECHMFYCKIGDRDYGIRDFALQDPNGNQIDIEILF